MGHSQTFTDTVWILGPLGQAICLQHIFLQKCKAGNMQFTKKSSKIKAKKITYKYKFDKQSICIVTK